MARIKKDAGQKGPVNLCNTHWFSVSPSESNDQYKGENWVVVRLHATDELDKNGRPVLIRSIVMPRSVANQLRDAIWGEAVEHERESW